MDVGYKGASVSYHIIKRFLSFHSYREVIKGRKMVQFSL